MKKKSFTPEQRAEIIAAFIGANFIEAARYLRDAQEETPELFEEVVKLTGIGMRKAYYLAEIDRRFRKLGVDRNRLRAIGWTKLQIIGRHIDKINLEELLSLAETHTAYELNSLMRGEQPHPETRCVVHYFTPEQFEVFEKSVLANGGVKSGRGLLDKEEALAKALSK